MRVFGNEHVRRLRGRERPVLMAVWHGRMMAPVWHNRRRGIVAMVSRHKDGEMVARLVHRLGYETVRGSSTRGGTQAALELLDKIRDGQPGAMICDGPRGPIYKMKPGTPYLAMQAGAMVIPTSFAASSRWILSSWDRFQVPRPFARVYIVYGDPIPPPDSQTDIRTFARALEQALNDVMARADELAQPRQAL